LKKMGFRDLQEGERFVCRNDTGIMYSHRRFKLWTHKLLSNGERRVRHAHLATTAGQCMPLQQLKLQAAPINGT
jgi:hypothetical protein